MTWENGLRYTQGKNTRGQTYTINICCKLKDSLINRIDRKMLLPGKKKQGPMEEIGPCYQKGDHLRIIAKSQANAGIIALFA